MGDNKKIIGAVRIGLIICGISGLIFLIISFFNHWNSASIITAILFLAIFFIFFVVKLRSVPQEERIILESFGKFFGIFGPGLIWLCPVVIKQRKAVSLSEQRSRLYQPGTDHSITIDFKDGSAAPVRAFVFWQIAGAKELLERQAKGEPITEKEIKDVNENIFRFVYAGVDVERFLVTRIENATRSYLNGFEVDEGVQKGKAGYNIFNGIEAHNQKEADDIKNTLKDYGLAVPKVVIGDFELSKETIKARSLVMDMQKEREGSLHKSKTMAIKTARARLESLSEITGVSVPNLQEMFNADPDLRDQFMSINDVMLNKQLGYEAKARFDLGVDGANGVEKALLNAILALKTSPLGNVSQDNQKEEGSEKKEEIKNPPTESLWHRAHPMDNYHREQREKK